MKKRLIATLVSLGTVLLALCVVLVTVSVRNRRPPNLEEIRGEIAERLQASLAVNEMLWGEGLPTYPRVTRTLRTYTVTRGSGEDEKNYTIYYYTFPDATYGTVLAYQYFAREATEGGGYTVIDLERGGTLTGQYPPYRYAKICDDAEEGWFYHSEASGKYYVALPDFTEEDEPFYYALTDDANYDYVRSDCGYLTVSEIRAAAAKVYSADVMREIEEAVFTGVTAFSFEGGTSFARYRDIEKDDGTVLLGKINTDWRAFPVTDWVFEFDTMELVRPSNKKMITVSLYCAPRNDPAAREKHKFRFVAENGGWYLHDYTR